MAGVGAFEVVAFGEMAEEGETATGGGKKFNAIAITATTAREIYIALGAW